MSMWRPVGARPLSHRQVEVGLIVAFDHDVYRIVEVRDMPEDLWDEADAHSAKFRFPPKVLAIRPADLGDDPADRRRDLHLRYNSSTYRWFWVYPDEHYPVCVKCREPLPCREKVRDATVAAATEEVSRYEIAGVCPGCSEPVTGRQKSITFNENIVTPLGPPVTIHLRGQCWNEAYDYDRRWVAADPENRRTQLSCPGHVVNHNDGTYECSELTDCPGPTAQHVGYMVCRCPDCHARGSFGCRPSSDARLLTDRGAS